MTRLETWNQLQANGLKAYREIPEASCALASRRDTKQFKQFIGKQDGLTLDIGCGIEVPGYLDKHNLEHTTGIDPLPAVGDFAPMCRVTGMAEVLLDPESYFNLVILAGSLDHVMNPVGVLSEARRVVKPTGRIVVQIGIPNNMPMPHTFKLLYLLYSTVLKSLVSNHSVDNGKIQNVVATLPVPAGCPDPFHFKYYTEAEIEMLFTAAQLAITRRKRIPGSTFYELRK